MCILGALDQYSPTPSLEVLLCVGTSTWNEGQNGKLNMEKQALPVLVMIFSILSLSARTLPKDEQNPVGTQYFPCYVG